MQSFKKVTNIAGLVIFTIAFIVYCLTAERTGSLWDCGEFVLGAFKLQVVHPPGAGLFVLVGRMFAWIGSLFSDDPSNIAFAINIMSGFCAALGAMLIGWVTMIFGKMAWIGRESEPDFGQSVALGFSGVVAGLSSAFITSVWFSAVEGEVYAMSTFFTCLTVWTAVKWYHLPDEPKNDRWLVLSLFTAGLSVGVHLLSLLTLPALAMLYYYKKYQNKNIKGLFVSIFLGFMLIAVVMKGIIAGIPSLWKNLELFCVNSLGLPIHSGLVPTLLIVAAGLYFLFKLAVRYNSQTIQNIAMGLALICVAYSTVGVIVIRANADTPVNMNAPKDAMSLLPYLNREQYGERPLLKGPHYAAKPIDVTREERYGRVGDKYKIVDEKFDYVWKNSDMIMFPRIGHQDKADLHETWKEYLTHKKGGKPTAAYNWSYFWNYQLNWMYWRYFHWNFSGRQNSDQGTAPWNIKDGNWISGISFIDNARLYHDDLAPDTIKQNPSSNKYYFIPLILGIIGLVYQFMRSRKDALALLMLFFITGIGIIIYSNQPPIEPRERDYVSVGSFVTFCIWIGFGVLAIYDFLRQKMSNGLMAACIAGAIGLASPGILLSQNFNDHDRSEHYAARDYAANFLNSLDKNAILFTYGDNDTYPLWYAQEVEGIRRDVRVVNLSLIQVDWYINKLRSKVNDSEAIKLTIPAEAYSGKNLNQVFFTENTNPSRLNIIDVFKNLATQTKTNDMPSLNFRNFYIPFDKSKAKPELLHLDSLNLLDSIPVSIPASASYLTKDDIAILDLVASNIQDRPIYFSVTCKNDKLQGLNDYMQLEGLGLRVIPAYNKSDRGFAIYGSGRVEKDKSYNRIMKDWKWGNFDKFPTHVDKSYLAGVQSMKITMLRTAYAMLNSGDTTRAVNMVNEYFEKFPHFNFPYDGSIVPFLNILSSAKAYEPLKKNLEILAKETKQFGDFYQSLDDNEILSFSNDMDMLIGTVQDVKRLSATANDSAFDKKMKDLMGDLDVKLQKRSMEIHKDQQMPDPQSMQ